MGWFAAIVIGAPLFVALIAWLDIRRARPATDPAPYSKAFARKRGIIRALFWGMALSTLGPEVLCLMQLGRESLKANQHRPPCGGPGLEGLATVGVVWLALTRILPMLAAFFSERRRVQRKRSRPTPSGLIVVRTVLLASVIALTIGIARFAIGGIAQDDFATQGALTPDRGVRGFRLRWLLAHVAGWRATPQPISIGPTLHFGETRCGGYSESSPSLHDCRGFRVQVAGKAFFIQGTAKQHQFQSSRYEIGYQFDAPLNAHEITDVDPNHYADRRLYFEHMPRYLFGENDVLSQLTGFAISDPLVLLDQRADGSTFVIKLDPETTVDEVGPLLRPPLWPIALLAVITIVTGLATRIRKPPRAPQLSAITYRSLGESSDKPFDRSDRVEETPPKVALRRLAFAWALYAALCIFLVTLHPYF
ncbi:MAG: hypothetical protein NVSMB1_26480 [Polyangiales bacterium]